MAEAKKTIFNVNTTPAVGQTFKSLLKDAGTTPYKAMKTFILYCCSCKDAEELNEFLSSLSPRAEWANERIKNPPCEFWCITHKGKEYKTFNLDLWVDVHAPELKEEVKVSMELAGMMLHDTFSAGDTIFTRKSNAKPRPF